MRRSLRAVVAPLTFIVCVSLPRSAQSKPEPKPKMEKTYKFLLAPLERGAIRDGPGHAYWYSRFRVSREGVVSRLSVGVEEGRHHFPVKVPGTYTVEYPELKAGSIIPLYGALFRVASVNHDSSTDHVGRFSVELVEDKKLLAEIGVRDDSYVVPAGGVGELPAGERDDPHSVRALGRFMWGGFAITRIDVVMEDGKKVPVAKTRFAALREGEDYKHLHYRYHVRKIVPPDESRGVIGWVEFDPTPLKDDRK